MRSDVNVRIDKSLPRRLVRLPRLQRGVVLLVALIFLILITLLALSSSGSSLLQEKMVGATRNHQLAEMAANSALRDAESRLYIVSAAAASASAPASMDFPNAVRNCGKGLAYDKCRLYSKVSPATNFQTFKSDPTLDLGSAAVQQYSWAFQDGGTDLTTGQGNANLAAQPRFIVEDLGEVTPGGPQREAGATNFRNATGNQTITLYRITARGVGGNKNARAVVQSTFQALGHQ